MCFDKRTLNVDTPVVGIESESLQSALLAETFGLVDELVTTVVSSARVTLRVLVLRHC